MTKSLGLADWRTKIARSPSLDIYDILLYTHNSIKSIKRDPVDATGSGRYFSPYPNVQLPGSQPCYLDNCLIKNPGPILI